MSRGRLRANPGTSGTFRPDSCVILHRLDGMSAGQMGTFPTGQTGHVHGMVAVQKWGCPGKFLYACWVFFLFPEKEGKTQKEKDRRDMESIDGRPARAIAKT